LVVVILIKIEWLENDDIITPKRLLSKIISRRYKESQKRKHERNIKYDFSKEILPSLKQVFTLLIN
jgi:hypothetical protein